MGAEHVDKVFFVRLGGISRSYARDGMVNPLNVTLMHGSHQIPQLQRTANCLLQLVSPSIKRANCEGVDVTVRVMVTEKISRDSLVMMAM